MPETSAVKGVLLAIFDGTLGSGDRSNNASHLLQSAGDNAGGSRGAAAASVLRAAAARFLHLVRFGHLNGLRYHGLALKMGVEHPAPSIVLLDNAKNFSSVICSLQPVSCSSQTHPQLSGVPPK